MTPRQKDVFKFVCDYMTSHAGVSPAFWEIADAIGAASKSTVHQIVHELIERGLLRREGGSHRNLVPVLVDSEYLRAYQEGCEAALRKEIDRRSDPLPYNIS